MLHSSFSPKPSRIVKVLSKSNRSARRSKGLFVAFDLTRDAMKMLKGVMEQRTQKTGVRKQATGFGSGSVRFPSRSQNEHAEAAKQKVAVRKADVSSSRRSSHIQHPQGIKTRACIQEQSQKLEQGPGDTCRQEGALETGEDRAGVEEKGEKEENDQTLSVSESAPEKASLKSMGLQMKVEAEKKSQLTAEGKGGGARVSEWGGAQRSNQAEQLAHGSGEEDGVKWWRGWAAQDGDGREAGDSEEQRADWVDRERAHFEWQQRAWAKKERLWGEEERLCEDEIALRREENERRRARMEREEELWRQAQQQQHQGGAAHIERFSGSKRGAESQAGEQGGDKRQRVEGELPADAQHADRAFAHAKEGPVGRRQEAAAPEKSGGVRHGKGRESELLKRTFGEEVVAVYREDRQNDLNIRCIWRRTCKRMGDHDSYFNVKKRTHFDGAVGFLQHLVESGWFSGTEPPMESLTDSAKPKKLRRVCIEQVLEDLTILCSSQRYAQVKQAA